MCVRGPPLLHRRSGERSRRDRSDSTRAAAEAKIRAILAHRAGLIVPLTKPPAFALRCATSHASTDWLQSLDHAQHQQFGRILLSAWNERTVPRDVPRLHESCGAALITDQGECAAGARRLR